jgi:hypothetical protein
MPSNRSSSFFRPGVRPPVVEPSAATKVPAPVPATSSSSYDVDGAVDFDAAQAADGAALEEAEYAAERASNAPYDAYLDPYGHNKPATISTTPRRWTPEEIEEAVAEGVPRFIFDETPSTNRPVGYREKPQKKVMSK